MCRQMIVDGAALVNPHFAQYVAGLYAGKTTMCWIRKTPMCANLHTLRYSPGRRPLSQISSIGNLASAEEIFFSYAGEVS